MRKCIICLSNFAWSIFHFLLKYQIAFKIRYFRIPLAIEVYYYYAWIYVRLQRTKEAAFCSHSHSITFFLRFLVSDAIEPIEWPTVSKNPIPSHQFFVFVVWSAFWNDAWSVNSIKETSTHRTFTFRVFFCFVFCRAGNFSRIRTKRSQTRLDINRTFIQMFWNVRLSTSSPVRHQQINKQTNRKIQINVDAFDLVTNDLCYCFKFNCLFMFFGITSAFILDDDGSNYLIVTFNFWSLFLCRWSSNHRISFVRWQTDANNATVICVGCRTTAPPPPRSNARNHKNSTKTKAKLIILAVVTYQVVTS